MQEGEAFPPRSECFPTVAQANIFGIVPLSLNEWALVLLFSSPVILIDEVLKFVGRKFVNPHTELPEKYKQLVADGKLDGKVD
jgi:hypothetical protein